jgi:hypothetical protein
MYCFDLFWTSTEFLIHVGAWQFLRYVDYTIRMAEGRGLAVLSQIVGFLGYLSPRRRRSFLQLILK